MNNNNEILHVALELCKVTNNVTTLEIKQELIQRFPKTFWKQQDISDAMVEFAQEGKFTYTDNGTFRTYSSVAIGNLNTMVNKAVKNVKKANTVAPTIVICSRTELAKHVEQNKGHFITIVHKKKTTGESNLMNVQVYGDKTELGAFRCKEKGQVKQFYPTDLLEVRVKNFIYKLK